MNSSGCLSIIVSFVCFSISYILTAFCSILDILWNILSLPFLLSFLLFISVPPSTPYSTMFSSRMTPRSHTKCQTCKSGMMFDIQTSVMSRL